MRHASLVTLPLPDLTKEPLGPDDRDTVNIDAIIRFFRRSWRLCLIWISASLCVSILFLILAQPYYAAATTILLEERPWRPLVDATGAVNPDPAYADSQVELLQSDEVVGRVVDQERLVSDPEFGGGGTSIYAPILSYISPRFASNKTPRHATMTRVKHALFIRRIGLTNVIEIGVTSRNPVRAATIANAIAQSYIDGQQEQRQAARADAASYIRGRLAELRQKAFAVDQAPQYPSVTTPEAGAQARTQLREQQNDTEVYRALYNIFMQRAYTEYDAPSGARVISPADPPTQRSWPRAILILAMAALGGATGGIGHALLRQATDHSLNAVQDVQRSIGIDRVVVVPVIGRRAWKTGLSGLSWPETRRFPRLSITAIGQLLRPLAAYGKTFRQLGWRAALMHHSRSRTGSQVRDEPRQQGLQSAYLKCSPGLFDVMSKLVVRLGGSKPVSSRFFEPAPSTQQAPEAGAGKRKPRKQDKLIIAVAAPTREAGASSVAAHLARIIATTGRRTLLVDANWRKSSAAGALPNWEPVRKLGNTIATVPSEPESLDVLVLRATAPISEFNAALSIVTTLQELEYACVVVDFDSPERTADLEACMTVITEVIVVAEAGRTSSERLRDFVRLIPRNKLAAIVLNKVDRGLS
jgi:capsular polysaccharide biosynthesis protein